MINKLSDADIRIACQSLVTARETSMGIEVTMPIIYPDGSAVNVMATLNSGECIVHDAGGGAMYLTSYGKELKKILQRKLTGIAEQYGCEFINGRMRKKCEPEQLAVAIALVANASRSVGDQAIEVRNIRAHSFTSELTNQLRETVGRRLRDRQEITGDSGRVYRVGHVLLDQNESRPVAFIEAVANEDGVPRRVSEFLDLEAEHPDVACESIYDDEYEWKPPDLALLGRVSNPVPFSESKQRVSDLAEAA